MSPPRYRSLFISDVHLGTKDAQAEALLDFLRQVEADRLYLIGDIIDGWALKRRWQWAQSHSDVIQKILRKARKGTQVTYVIGNHDEFVKDFLPLQLGESLSIVDETEYVDLQGRRHLVVHGDQFDPITINRKWLAHLGDQAYMLLLRLNRPLNRLRKLIGYKRYWSLAGYAKQKVKQSIMFISNYELVLSDQARGQGFDGVICGHIHKAEIQEMGEILYMNSGDWVESCTALVETLDGEWQLITHHAAD